MSDKINLNQKFAAFSEHWRPKIAAALNDHEVKLVKVQGVFPWHRHEDNEELFLVWRGRFRVEFRDHVVELGPGEMTVVPRGAEHRTAADEEAEVVLFERAGVVNTGDAPPDAFTAPTGARALSDPTGSDNALDSLFHRAFYPKTASHFSESALEFELRAYR